MWGWFDEGAIHRHSSISVKISLITVTDADYYDRDIIVGVPYQSGMNERRRDFLRRSVSQHAGNIHQADGFVETIAAQQKGIPSLQGKASDLNIERLFGTYRTGDDIRQGVMNGLLGRDQALVHQVLNVAVVMGQLL